MDTNTYLGLDPGKTGYLGVIHPVLPAELVPLPREPVALLELLQLHSPDVVLVEKVGPSPRQGSSAAFQFGRSAQLCECVAAVYQHLTAGSRLMAERPQQWKAAMGLMRPDRKAGTYRENKSAAKKLALELFPELKPVLTVESADAILIAEYARRRYGQ